MGPKLLAVLQAIVRDQPARPSLGSESGRAETVPAVGSNWTRAYTPGCIARNNRAPGFLQLRSALPPDIAMVVPLGSRKKPGNELPPTHPIEGPRLTLALHPIDPPGHAAKMPDSDLRNCGGIGEAPRRELELAQVPLDPQPPRLRCVEHQVQHHRLPAPPRQMVCSGSHTPFPKPIRTLIRPHQHAIMENVRTPA